MVWSNVLESQPASEIMSMFDSAVAEPHTDMGIDYSLWLKLEGNYSSAVKEKM